MNPKHFFICGKFLLVSCLLIACSQKLLPPTPVAPPPTAVVTRLPTLATSYFEAQATPPQSVGSVIPVRGFPLQLLWTFQAERPIHIPPRVGAGVVLATYGTPSITHLALDPSTGKELWQFPVYDVLGVYANARLIQSNTLILRDRMQVKAVDLATGQLVWQVRDYDIVWGIAANADSVFSISRKFITAINLASGEIVWRLDGANFRPSDIYYNDQTGHVIMIGKTIYVIDPATGIILSTIETPDYCARHGQLYQGRIYCSSSVNGFIMSEAETGITLSNADLKAFPAYVFTPLIQEDTIYISTRAGTVIAVDLDTLQPKWEYIPLPANDEPYLEIISNVAILGNVGYAIATDATLRAFDISSGQEIGRWQAPSVADWWRGGKGGVSDADPVPGVASDGSRVYASFGFDTLYAFAP